mmetsp:Transcript_9212/g.12195  ORF Transcript_9212/g.12195 Transcript_9212/m.12195 type:complete len:226 (+) Transcript_9212:300-977(+)
MNYFILTFVIFGAFCVASNLGFLSSSTLNLKSSRCTSRTLIMSSSEGQVSRREVLSAGAIFAASVGLASGSPTEVAAIGPVKFPLENVEYKAVDCAGRKLPGSKAVAGLKAICVEITAETTSKEKKPVIDASVFGFVKDEFGNSVVANNPDASTDAGQFAIIDEIRPGKSKVSFQFVAAIPEEREGLGILNFESLKAISYPGGNRFKAISECDFNPSADECDTED